MPLVSRVVRADEPLPRRTRSCALKLSLLAMLGATMVLTAPRPAAAQGLTLRVCNKGSVVLKVARVTYRPFFIWRSEGWFWVQPRDCERLDYKGLYYQYYLAFGISDADGPPHNIGIISYAPSGGRFKRSDRTFCVRVGDPWLREGSLEELATCPDEPNHHLAHFSVLVETPGSCPCEYQLDVSPHRDSPITPLARHVAARAAAPVARRAVPPAGWTVASVERRLVGLVSGSECYISSTPRSGDDFATRDRLIFDSLSVSSGGRVHYWELGMALLSDAGWQEVSNEALSVYMSDIASVETSVNGRCHLVNLVCAPEAGQCIKRGGWLKMTLRGQRYRAWEPVKRVGIGFSSASAARDAKAAFDELRRYSPPRTP